MITAFELAGFFGAHAIWCVSDGETLIPILGHTDEEDNRHMVRLVRDELVDAVTEGRQLLAGNAMNANDAVLLFDGRISVGEEKLDAIVIEIRTYFSPASESVMAIPYTPAASGFKVHKPKLLVWANCDDFDPMVAFEAFFEGVAKHEKGAEVWNGALDESK